MCKFHTLYAGIFSVASCIFTLLAFNFAKFLHLLLFKELVDATKMFAHLSATKLVDTGYESVEEVTIMAHANERTIKIVESLLQYILGAKIKVVGRFVKNKQIDGFEQQLKQSQTSSLTT